MIANNARTFLAGILALIIVSSSFVNVYAQNGVVPDNFSTGRYSFADPNGSGEGEGSSSHDKTHPYYSTKYLNQQYSSVDAATVEANLLNGCNCVVFRLDDIQDYWLSDVQVAVMDQFVQKNQFLSVGPIVGLFGADANVVDKAIAGYNSGLFEINVHGWDHVDYSTLNLATQTSTLQDAQNKLQLLFGSASTVFVPPFNTFNANTLTALQATGFNIISAAEWSDTYPYFIADGTSDVVDANGNYHFPETIGFTDWVGGAPVQVPNSQILAAIDSSVSSKGFAVVTVHSQQFAQVQGGSQINVIDQSKIADLNSLIDEVIAKNYPIRTFTQVVEFNQSPPLDTEAPVIDAHADVNEDATDASGATVSYTSPATSDNVDPPGTATCAPLSGTVFPIGTTEVTCNATDVAGNPAIPTTFDVIVSDLPDSQIQIAGWRSSQNGDYLSSGHDQSDPDYWISVAEQMTAKFPGSTPGGVLVVGEVDGASFSPSTFMPFPAPAGTYPNVTFGTTDTLEPLLDAYDAAGLKVYLQVEPADADVSMLMDLVMNQYKHHPSVIGFGLDVYWYKHSQFPGTGKPLVDSEVNTWAAQVKTFDPDYMLFVKHWDSSYLSNARPDNVLFLIDSSGIGSLSGAIAEYLSWIDHFGDSQVGFQIGSPSDQSWWSTLNDPASEIMNPVIATKPNANIGAIFWVDFSVLAAFPPIGSSSITINDISQVEDDSGTITDDNFTPFQLFSDDFESGFAKWTESGEGDWNIESPSEIQVPGHSSNLVAHSDNCDSSCTITMKNSIDLSSYSSATLSFWRFVDNALDNGEYLKVELYDGSQWNTIYNWTHGSGDDNSWHKETVNLDSYLDVNDFNVRFVTHESRSFEDAEIDDVVIIGLS
ncbi:MAG: polysaccharide deacetylase family protein [Nitrosopumilaceae archaeon]